MKYKNFKKNKKFALILLLTLLVVVIAAVIYVFMNSRMKTSGYEDGSGINYDPPTNEEKQAGDKQKDETLQEEKARNNSENQSKKSASVIITDAGQYGDTIEVRAFIPDHYQDGTCTILLTHGGYRVEKTTPAYRDASTTICTNPLIAKSEFAASGEWQVVVSFSSLNASGSSAPRAININ